MDSADDPLMTPAPVHAEEKKDNSNSRPLGSEYLDLEQPVAVSTEPQPQPVPVLCKIENENEAVVVVSLPNLPTKAQTPVSISPSNLSNLSSSPVPNTHAPTATATTPPPKKSARLAEKRKIREESGSSTTSQDNEFYFTPCKVAKTSNSNANANSSVGPSRSPPTVTVKPKPGVSSMSMSQTDVKLDTDDAADSSTSHLKASLPSSASSDLNTSTLTHPDPVHDAVEAEDEINPTAFLSLEIAKEEITEDAEEEYEYERNQSFNSDTPEIYTTYDTPTPDRQFSDEKESLDSSTLTQPQPVSQENKTISKRLDKTLRRRVLAQQKREQQRKKTIDKLLKTHETKVSKPQKEKIKNEPTNNKSHSQQIPMVSYLIRRENNCISFPVGFDGWFSGKKDTTTKTPLLAEPAICGVLGCTNRKKYNCSKTNVPLCSLECYKLNLKSKSVPVDDLKN